eukprot:TRINITY_DN862_c0_g1_i1.p1 TRINITY_DN862_c0_g1~~TRINITY_DN862_c0_g1_i1.p1  ORF type:complete len:379 (-),score=153.71 TRINITY_DN862_c0_g1_i1:8-1108(-)
MSSQEGNKVVRWGILSTGRICQDFATALKALKQYQPELAFEVVAVGSRGIESATSFAQRFNIPRSYGSYEELVKDPEIDIIYIGSPHSYHADHGVLALEAGKSVLCEKSLALSRAQVQTLVDLARSKNLFFMEAIWTRYFPFVRSIFGPSEDGNDDALIVKRLGTIQYLNVTFGFIDQGVPRLSEPDLGGGALLDIGVYCVHLSDIVFQGETPVEIKAVGKIHPEFQTDRQIAITLTYSDNRAAHLLCTFLAHAPNEVTAIGTSGFLRIHTPFWCPTKATLRTFAEKDKVGTEEVFEHPLPEVPEGHRFNFRNSIGLMYEAAYAVRQIQKGATESAIHGQDGSLRIMAIMDEIRRQVGVRYPCDLD